jgi:hypothetical protein
MYHRCRPTVNRRGPAQLGVGDDACHMDAHAERRLVTCLFIDVVGEDKRQQRGVRGVRAVRQRYGSPDGSRSSISQAWSSK